MRAQFSFSDEERDQVTRALLALTANPYREYAQFVEQIKQLADDPALPGRVRAFIEDLRHRAWTAEPLVRASNCPIDPVLPLLDPKDPVACKYGVKKTFVAEGFLALWGELTGTEVISHRSVNDGDRFHDIFPKESMYSSQSQKTLGTLRFHRDFTNHFVSPDFVNTLVLRDAGANEVLSTFTRNGDVLAQLDRVTLRVLRQPRFHTPFDDISVTETDVIDRIDRDAETHPLLFGECGLRVFEGRTVGLDVEATEALAQVLALLHVHKRSFVNRPGELVGFANDAVIHGREARRVVDPSALAQRWLMKTHNVWSLTAHELFFEPDAYGVVHG
jgi:L-asparagine oxygenase